MFAMCLQPFQTTQQGGNLLAGNLFVHGLAGKRCGERIGIIDGMQQRIVKARLKRRAQGFFSKNGAHQSCRGLVFGIGQHAFTLGHRSKKQKDAIVERSTLLRHDIRIHTGKHWSHGARCGRDR